MRVASFRSTMPSISPLQNGALKISPWHVCEDGAGVGVERSTCLSTAQLQQRVSEACARDFDRLPCRIYIYIPGDCKLKLTLY
jgi:hypothetical protein